MENPDLVPQETGSRPTYSRLNYVPSGDTLRRDTISSFKILTGNIFGLILKNKMADTCVSLSVMKSTYISLIIGPRGLGW